ncbi:MAG: NAD-dependent epimerase/dehydratase family protein [Phenylobacterium sp.]|uniref:NAD-dependent epimerase/dehydratase family protein n=1 Tax=Phenylobacterium sp. TaxID=1871053 RepID=UPI00271EC3B2|nr:NAD-dependent epimerase/dehydratase family protein [Phenylobacterium sp.]MDO8900621.1 NAD-dependent epimerase/dehydratase family protein [Phenylobacterium sp.]
MSGWTIIGAGGFIGGRLAQALRDRGEAVYAPARGDPALFERDLGRVFYCAGLTGDFAVRPFDTVEAHVTLLAQVLSQARFDRLIYLSSTRLYDSLGAAGGREDDILAFDPAAPRNVYDLSKALGENLTLARSGGRGAVARLSNVFDLAPGASGFLPELLQKARRSREITLDSVPGAVRDYVHADDVIAALLAMGESQTPGVVNVASGQNVSNADLAQVFGAAGWTLNLTPDRPMPAAPHCAIDRLQALGIAPQDPRQLIAEALAAPGFFLG